MADHILPYYLVESLPSNFIGYPKGTKIECRPYSFGEQMNLQIAGENGKKLFKNILDGVRCNIPKNTITTTDCIYLGIFRKLISTKQDKITVETTCPVCLHRNKHTFTLKDLKFKNLEFDKLPIIANLQNYVLYFELMTVKRLTYCLDKFNGEALSLFASQVTRIDEVERNEDFEIVKCKQLDLGEEKLLKKAREIIGTATDIDKEVLDDVATYLSDYGLTPLDLVCQDELCKADYTVQLEENNVLVYPFRESDKSARNRIKFGNESDNKSDRPAQNELSGSGTAD